MNASPDVAAHDERGFILVGVVMFMLALTILGLSLFALSSYEAQFFYASQSREQSLQSSESGMELVKALLSANPQLQSARLAVGQLGITQALAYQARSSDPNDTTSNGPVNWDSTLVVVVSARAGGEERTVQSRFVPVVSKSPYHQLISCGQNLSYNLSKGTSRSMQLTGAVWQPVQTAADSTWTRYVDWRSGRPIDPSTPPALSASTFVDAKRLLASPVDDSDFASNSNRTPRWWIEFSNRSGSPKPYYSPPSPANDTGLTGPNPPPELADYEFYSEHTLELRIHGTVIWVVKEGVCFRHKVTVVPDPAVVNDPNDPNVLVIVAKPNRGSANPNRAIWFQGGLEVSDSTATKVFLVSQGEISLTNARDGNDNENVRAVSVVAGGGVELMGPSNASLKVAHASSMNAIADDLLARGWLPALSGGTGVSFEFAKYSWHESRLP